MLLNLTPNKQPEDRPPYRKKRGRLVLSVKDYKKLLIEVFTRDGWKCRVDGCSRRNDLHGHHLLFKSHGGDDAPWNILTICQRCHDAIHNRWLIVHPAEDGTFDASKELRFEFVCGWRPKKKIP